MVYSEVQLRTSWCYVLVFQDCYLEHGDWRKCQREVKEFKWCIKQSNEGKGKDTLPDEHTESK